MSELVRTKSSTEEEYKKESEFRILGELPLELDMKRTIARMFANPILADEISKSELERRQRLYAEEKLRKLEKQSEMLSRESLKVSQEILQMRREASKD